MPDYHDFTAPTANTDWPAVLTNIRTVVNDATVAGMPFAGSCRLKRQGVWSDGDIAATQGVIGNAAAMTVQTRAQRTIDAWPLESKALVLALIDQLNVIRVALPSPLAPITPAQALAAIRTKAGTL